ncbi:hypothetical protein C2845_PM02G01300 [Panicum miliaceum]|uniref:Uncharacterized protein n=1 Tax=Panicum miliaceum TaxID=4540 RepID=A0A3L6SGA1_PANMI|nr:hypothetical protein C2845_PM02G01300 [Panicum miliaceum]
MEPPLKLPPSTDPAPPAPPSVAEAIAPPAPPPRTRAMKTKKAGTAQPSRGHAPVQSPAAQSAPASTETTAGHAAMDGAQQVVKESPTRFVL